MDAICTLHDQAIHFANEAFSLKKAGRHEEARQKFLQACELESESAFHVEKLPENEPSRSMLFLGAASLAWYGEDFELAERLVGEGMSGYPSDNTKNDLKKLFDDIKFSVGNQKAPAGHKGFLTARPTRASIGEEHERV
jgi:hypothetical protein